MPGRRSTLCALTILLTACVASGPGSPPGAEPEPADDAAQSEAVFDQYTPLSGNAEVLRRMLSPLAVLQLQRTLTASGKGLRPQEIDLSAERFVLYVPRQAPPQGYGLLVFVPPWRRARLPQGWGGVLDQRGLIFVSAQNSGNDVGSVGRREPLALLAAHNVINRYKIDPQRVYVSGFSGGSRVAQRLALGYPDLFHGALLDAGSDPIGEAEHPLPPRELFQRFQNFSRLVYVSGERDTMNTAADADSADSMRQWCAFHVETQTTGRAGGSAEGHEALDAAALAKALDALLAPLAPDARLLACRARIEAELEGKLKDAEALAAAGKRDRARKQLEDIDTRYGGLAAPRSVELYGTD